MRRSPIVAVVVALAAFLLGAETPVARGRGQAGTPVAGGNGRTGPLVRFGVVTDVHYADVEARGTRMYREARAKLEEAVAVMNRQKVEFLVELGDFKDQDQVPDEARTMGYLRMAEAVMTGFRGPRYHVIGNHDTDSISKAAFLSVVENTGIVPNATRYTFVRGGIRFVVLDACRKSDGSDYDRGNFDWTDTVIDGPQLAWLSQALTAAREPVMVFVHQQLDGTGAYYVKNAIDVRAVLEASGKVIGVLQGHRHEGAFSTINGIPYLTFRGLIEGAGPNSNAFGIAEVLPDLSVWITGYQRAESRGFRAGTADALLHQKQAKQ